jgi:hypothetical protein
MHLSLTVLICSQTQNISLLSKKKKQNILRCSCLTEYVYHSLFCILNMSTTQDVPVQSLSWVPEQSCYL